jgi:hypothetical protein
VSDVKITTQIGGLTIADVVQKIIDGWECQVGDIIIDEDGKHYFGVTLIRRPASDEEGAQS